jgi:hypothetical protein
MTINRTSLSSQSIQTNTNTVIEVIYNAPQLNDPFDPPQVPGKLIGYYNGSIDMVQLYVVTPDGLFLNKI